MKKYFALCTAALIASNLWAGTPVLSINGLRLDKTVTSLTFDGDYVVAHFGDEAQTFDMETVDVKFESSGIQGLEIYSLSATITDRLNLSGIKVGSQIEIYAMAGTVTYSTQATDESLSIDIAGWPSGLYLLRVGCVCVKFVKR